MGEEFLAHAVCYVSLSSVRGGLVKQARIGFGRALHAIFWDVIIKWSGQYLCLIIMGALPLFLIRVKGLPMLSDCFAIQKRQADHWALASGSKCLN